MRLLPAALSILLMTAVLSGCLDAGSGKDDAGNLAPNPIRRVVEPATQAISQVTDVVFAPVRIIDNEHAGGEPVILVDKKGVIIVASHPGYTHLRGPDTDLVTSSTGQAFVWRSENGGETWEFIGLPVGNVAGPRNAATSVSDPDLTMRPDGAIILTTLQSLATIPVEISTDSGKTWSGQPLHGPPGVDRNWVAACNNQDVYQVYSSFGHLPLTLIPNGPFGTGGRWLAHSTDGGQTWTDQHATNAPGNIICDQNTEDGKYLYAGSGPVLAVSSDKVRTFTRANTSALGDLRGSGGLSRPAVDAAGNVYTVGIENGTTGNESSPPRLYYTVSTDHGQTFARYVHIPTAGIVNGSHIWPWIVAQDEGRIGIVFYGTSSYGAPPQFGSDVDWHVFSVIVPNALDAEPTAYITQASNVPIHKGPICLSGTTCQANPNQSGDRRLGDFFTAYFDHSGALLIATASTQSVPATGPVDGGGLAHPAFIKQVAGPGGLANVAVGMAMDHAHTK
jgi:hypothetical protein